MVLKSSMAWLNSRRRTCRWGLLLLSCPLPPLPLPLPLLLEPPLLLLRLKRLVILGAGPPRVMPTYWQDGYVSISFYQCHPSRFHFFTCSVSHSNTTLAVDCYEFWKTKAPLVNATRYLNLFCMAVCTKGCADATKKLNVQRPVPSGYLCENQPKNVHRYITVISTCREREKNSVLVRSKKIFLKLPAEHVSNK